MSFKVGDKFTSKKPHACGSKEWEIVRVGADYKIKCLSCNRVVLVDYNKLAKLIRKKEV